VWWRLVLPLAAPWWQIATAALPVLGVTFPLAMIRSRRRPRAIGRRALLFAYVWFGILIYALLGAIASHVAVGFGADAGTAATVCGAAALAVVGLGLVNVARGPIARRVRVPIPRLPVASYRIVQLTDVHVGTLIGREFVTELVRRVNALEPDLVVITGDLIDGPLAELRTAVEPLRELRARDGVYASTGNHEYYWQIEPWLRELDRLGVRVLRNEHVTIRDVLALAGTDDMVGGEDLARAVAGRDPELPLVLLAHRPRTVTRALNAGVDLQLSGHTHGGQLLPWGWLARLWDPKVAGLGRFGPTWLYVGQGTGYWGPPLRVGTHCEIGVLTLVPA
jgi:uncharacterized protein